MVYMLHYRNIASSILSTSCKSKLLKYKRGTHVNVPSIVKETYRDVCIPLIYLGFADRISDAWDNYTYPCTKLFKPLDVYTGL